MTKMVTNPIYEPKGNDDLSEKSFSVYIHTFPNGKKYIGISKDIKRRFRNGKGYEGQPIVWAAIKKYGWKNVKTEIVLTGLSEEEAKEKEIFLISKYKTNLREFGYNQTLGGEGANGRKLTESQKREIGERMSACNKGKKLTKEHKEKISMSLKGKKKNYTEEGRKRIIQSNRTRVYSKETREKMSRNTKIGMKNKNMSEYLSKKWKEEKEIRNAKTRLTMYNRYGVTYKNHNIEDDIVLLGLQEEYFEANDGN